MAEVQNIGHTFRYEKGKLIVTGVRAVDSYDDKSVEVLLNGGRLSISGSGFLLEEMDLKSGQLVVNGLLHTLTYREKGEKVGLVKRIFR